MARRTSNPYARPDSRTLQAKSRGYPARSVFKLEEIDRRVRLLKAGDRVLDLGAAPGSWSLYASQKVGDGGRVVAVDLSPIEQAFGSQVIVVQGDALTPGSAAIEAGAPYDVVMSDMAPKTCGNKTRDQALSFELCSGALAVAGRYGKPGSHFVAKIFMGPDFAEAKRRVSEAYREVRTVRPEGTRSNSSEVFLVGLGRK